MLALISYFSTVSLNLLFREMDKYRVGEVVSHRVSPLKDDFPELKTSPKGWSLKGTEREIFPTFYETESSVLPGITRMVGGLSSDESSQYLDFDEPPGQYEEHVVGDMEGDLTGQYKRTRFQTVGQRRLINCVNLYSVGLYVDYSDMMTIQEYEHVLKTEVAQMEDLQVILQESLVWTQTAKRERITEVFVPIFQPYGASQDDFENAKFTEDTGYCLFGNCSESYSAWAEINPGRTVFFFSCYSESGWYTYLYTGECVHCIGRQKFRGFAFENDEVIYSMEDTKEMMFFDHYKPVVNLNWTVFPLSDCPGLKRIVCKRNGQDHVVLNAIYNRTDEWASKWRISDLREMYFQGQLSPVVQAEMTQVKDWYEAKGMVNYTLNELNNCYSDFGTHDQHDVPLVPVLMESERQLLTLSDKAIFLTRMKKVRYKGMLVSGILNVWMGKSLYSSLRVRSVVRANVIVVVMLENHHRLSSLTFEEIKNQSMFLLVRQGNDYVSADMNWGYRYISGMRVNQSELKMRFTYTNVVSRGSTSFVGRVCSLTDVGPIYVETGRCYRRLSLCFLT